MDNTGKEIKPFSLVGQNLLKKINIVTGVNLNESAIYMVGWMSYTRQVLVWENLICTARRYMYDCMVASGKGA